MRRDDDSTVGVNNTPDGWISRDQKSLEISDLTIYAPGDPRYWDPMNKAEQDVFVKAARMERIQRCRSEDGHRGGDGDKCDGYPPVGAISSIPSSSFSKDDMTNGFQGANASYGLYQAGLMSDYGDERERSGCEITRICSISRDEMEGINRRGREIRGEEEGVGLWGMMYGA
ncbi:hypothetical protein EAF04_005793 [Stromatinia cepivora]|nr:hypothetical protein EAF04_005793 [Stromatinia cepivora]